MTRKDYIIIAEAIVDQYHSLISSNLIDSGATGVGLDDLIEPMAQRLQAANYMFDRQKFRDYIIRKIG